jgi:HEAT repeat protein
VLAPFFASVLAFGAGACDRTTSAGTDPSHEAELKELVEVLSPLGKTVTSDITDRRFLRGRELLAKLGASERACGERALEMLKTQPAEGKPRPVDVERALLDIGARAAPEDARPLLETLITEYGPSLDLRTEATLLLAETAPKRAVEILEPLVTQARPGKTLPPPEFIVEAFTSACDKIGRSPVPELADVATNLYMDETARIRAVKKLGHRNDPLALKALQAILVESTGDGYLRRMAAQGLRDTLSREDACDIFRNVADHEADLNFIEFLRDMLEKNCSRG